MAPKTTHLYISRLRKLKTLSLDKFPNCFNFNSDIYIPFKSPPKSVILCVSSKVHFFCQVNLHYPSDSVVYSGTGLFKTLLFFLWIWGHLFVDRGCMPRLAVMHKSKSPLHLRFSANTRRFWVKTNWYFELLVISSTFTKHKVCMKKYPSSSIMLPLPYLTVVGAVFWRCL